MILSVRPVYAVDQTVNIIKPAGPRLISVRGTGVTHEDDRLAKLGDHRAVVRLARESFLEMPNRDWGFIAQESDPPPQASQPWMTGGRSIEQRDGRLDAPVDEIQLDAQRRRVRIIAWQGLEDLEDPLLLLGLVEEQIRERQPTVPVIGVTLNRGIEFGGDPGIPVREMREPPCEQIVVRKLRQV